MDLLKKVELLINAKTRSALPRRKRTSPLDEEEARLLAEIRAALGDVTAKERELAGRIKTEQAQAEAAAERGDIENHVAHTRRLTELEHHLKQESTLAINLEEKLAELEAQLNLAQQAVEREEQKAARRAAEADSVLAQDEAAVDPRVEEILRAAPEPAPPQIDDVDLDRRKSRLSD